MRCPSSQARPGVEVAFDATTRGRYVQPAGAEPGAAGAAAGHARADGHGSVRVSR